MAPFDLGVEILLWVALIAFVLWLIGLFMSRRRGV